MAWGKHINDCRDAWEVVRRADHPNVGLVLDSFHALARKTDHAPMQSIPRDRILLVQVADAALLDMDYLSGAAITPPSPARANCRSMPSWRPCRRQAMTGSLSHEIFSARFRAGAARSVAIDGQRWRVFTVDELRRRTG